jgi:lipopolysaccharide/colanic/teichoic acid biosynthesis glycosyltransferase
LKETFARFLLVCFDVLAILISLSGAFYLRHFFNDFFNVPPPEKINFYLQMYLIYGIVLIVLYFEGVYTKRFDFWQEHKRIGKALLVSSLVVLAVLALQKETEYYSRFILIVSFGLMFILIPSEKFIIKRWLYKMGLWRRQAIILGEDPFFEKHVFENPYLGYIKGDINHSKTLFIASDYRQVGEIETVLDQSVKCNQEVIFIPLVKSYDFTDSHIIHLFNARTNLVVLENKLLNPLNQTLKGLSDYLLSVLLLPFAFIVMIIIAFLIKKEEPKGRIWFKQERMGREGKIFICYKFRTMYENSDPILEEYLRHNPQEVQNYAIYHKYENDPRITEIGHFLRKSSLDELPQIFNVLKREMSLIGPRPYMNEERPKIGIKLPMVLAVKPGITGLWQVSGRNEVDFSSRVSLDVWYVRNWSLWTDFVILMKTVKVVLQREGAT